MAREDRVAQFGELSQEMVNNHPLSAKVRLKPNVKYPFNFYFA